MNNELFEKWKDKKSQIEVSKNFANEVISKIYAYEEKRRKPFIDIQRIVTIIYSNTLAKAAMITICAAVGILKMVFAYLFSETLM